MTQTPRLAIKCCPTTLAWLKETLEDGLDNDLSAEEREALCATLLELRVVGANMDVLTKATHIDTVAGVEFYEHPEEGDEAPLMAYIPEQGAFLESSGFWDIPEEDEVETWLESLKHA